MQEFISIPRSITTATTGNNYTNFITKAGLSSDNNNSIYFCIPTEDSAIPTKTAPAVAAELNRSVSISPKHNAFENKMRGNYPGGRHGPSGGGDYPYYNNQNPNNNNTLNDPNAHHMQHRGRGRGRGGYHPSPASYSGGGYPPHPGTAYLYMPQQQADSAAAYADSEGGKKQEVFVRDSNGMSWSCRHCNSIPLFYRARGSVWQNPEPPSLRFIDDHLIMCRGNTIPGQGPAAPPRLGQAHFSPQSGVYGMVPQVVSGYNRPSEAIERNAIPPPNITPGFVMPPITIPKEYALIQEEDRLLLTDYFFYLMQQLQVCYFAESDRKTRGGKRDNIAVGFGGLQCRHCSKKSDARKFFWSDVDRLANSFAEIPNHVLRCRECPGEIKNNMVALKMQHPAQMARLPRGSQKVFFRRMWRRIHGDEDDAETSEGPSRKKARSSPEIEVDNDGKKSPGSSGVGRGAKGPAIITEDSRILLAIEDDKEWLSDLDCFVRKHLEIFKVTQEDIDVANQDMRDPIVLNQVGIRCLHCACTETGARGTAALYPLTISNIYESVRNFQRYHFEVCVNVPPEVQGKLASLSQCTSLSSVLRRYYVLAAKALGMQDAPTGIRFKNDEEPRCKEVPSSSKKIKNVFTGATASSPASNSDETNENEITNAPKTEKVQEEESSKIEDLEKKKPSNDDSEEKE